MPWCPVCKNEYKDGYTLCADCGAELVDFLSEESTEVNPAEQSVVDMEPVENFDIDENDEMSELLEQGVDATLADTLAKAQRANQTKPFVKASERAENYKSSAFALLLVGIIGVIFLALSYLRIIPLNLAANINALFYVVMGFMFVVFIVIGIKTMSSAKAIASTADDEDKLTAEIYAFFKENHSCQSIDEIAFSGEAVPLTEEEKFFPRSNTIKGIITEKFGKLDEAYLTELTENTYSAIFD